VSNRAMKVDIRREAGWLSDFWSICSDDWAESRTARRRRRRVFAASDCLLAP